MIPLAIFLFIQFFGCIALWLLISTTTRELNIKRSFSLLLSSVLSTIFLILVVRLCMFHLYFYVGVGIFWTIYTIYNAIRSNIQLNFLTILINELFWPHVLVYTMFLYSVEDQFNEDI